jgi:hypothetical protein
VPTISGYEQGLRRTPPDQVAALEKSFDEDERRRFRGVALSVGVHRHGGWPGPRSSRGANIVKVALEAPLKQIAVTAGLEGGGVAEEVRGLTAGEGLDAATGSLYSRTRQSSRAGRPPACHLAGSGCDQEGCEGPSTCLGS